MNGELVDWDDAKVHVLTHTLHYGTGVFEGIRAYETSQGPAIFRLTDHIERLHNSAPILMMDLPYSVEELVAGVQGHRAGHRAAVVLRAPDRLLRLRRDGVSTRSRARSTSPSPAGRGAPTWARRPAPRASGMKISSWTRHDHNTMPPAAKTTGNYVNSSLAKVEALKAGYDEAIMLNPQGSCQRVHRREHLRRPQRPPHHPAAHGRRPRGHHPELAS